MGSTRHRVILAVVAILVITAAIIGAFLLKNPSVGTTFARTNEEIVADAINRIHLALGVNSDAIVFQNKSLLPGSDVSLTWGGGGVAELDSESGRIILVSQDGNPPDPGAESLPLSDLDAAADLTVSLLGYDEATLLAGNFSEEESRMTSQATNQYRKSWVGHTSTGVLNGSSIHIWLDSRDKTVLRFLFFPGVGEVSVDTASAISEEKAIKIAEEAVNSAAMEMAQLYEGQERIDASRVDIHLEEASLTLTNASAITSENPMLIWRVRFEGFNGLGQPAGGTVYIDAVTGQILQQLLN